MNNSKVRRSIPSDWSQKVTCPLCSVFRMQVVHSASGPDQLRCDSCGISIELELGGDQIHVVEWPEGTSALQEDVAGRWISVTELRILVRIQAASPRTSSNSPAAIRQRNEKILSEVGQTVDSLFGLGNTPDQILTILNENEGNPERVAANREMVNRLRQREQVGHARKLRSSMILAGVSLVFLIGLVTLLFSAFLSRPPAIAGTTQAPFLSGFVKTLNLEALLLQPTMTPVGTEEPKVSGCPQSAQEAAAVFGGQANDWSSPSSSGWVMLTTHQATTIFIPLNMSAGYLQFSNQINLTQVIGPATIKDIYYVAIKCR